MAQRDLKPKDLDSWGNSMLGKLSRTSKANIQRPVNKRRRARARKTIDTELEMATCPECGQLWSDHSEEERRWCGY